MTVKDQLNHKAKVAEQAMVHHCALSTAYRDAASLVEAVGDSAELVEEVIGAAVKFCRSHCFHGRKDGIGKSSECSICPLARWALGADGRRE